MEVKLNWDDTSLQDYLLYDYWKPYNAWCVLAGYEYETRAGSDKTIASMYILDLALSIEMLEFDVDPDAVTKIALMQKNFFRLGDFWHSGLLDMDFQTPAFFIDWALSKRFRPDWLDWAIERGLYKSESEEQNKQAEFDAEFDEMIGKASDNTNNQNDFVALDLLHYWIAKELWDGATEDQACNALASLKEEAILSALDGKGQMSAIEMATGMAAIENEININALIDAGAIPLYSPMTLRPTHDRIGAIVEKSVVLDKLASGEHLKFKRAQAKQEAEIPAQIEQAKTLMANFDKTSSTYPVELDIALQAWRAVTEAEGKGKPKARIRVWLDSNTDLSNEAKERIATVANWDKTGGATRSD
jgi:hypothetical protein